MYLFYFLDEDRSVSDLKYIEYDDASRLAYMNVNFVFLVAHAVPKFKINSSCVD